jgi:hypothetical protein
MDEVMGDGQMKALLKGEGLEIADLRFQRAEGGETRRKLAAPMQRDYATGAMPSSGLRPPSPVGREKETAFGT